MGDFTPGPWVDGPYGDIWTGVCKRDGKWDEVSPNSAVIVASAKRPEDRALIAAAPELLAACASVWLMLADTGDNELRLIADECRAALTSATHPGQEVANG